MSNVVVGFCTYNRPQGLKRLLEGLAAQKFERLERPHIELLVADNEDSLQTRAICEQFARDNPAIALNLVVEKRRGISHARNAVLDNVPETCDFLAMIDDDEVPDAHWLENLLRTQQATGSDIIRGPVRAVFSAGAPDWVKNGDYFGWPRKGASLEDGQPIRMSSTSNTLVRWRCISRNALRFDPVLSLTGGEDGVFFRKLQNAGCSIAFSSGGVVEAPVADSRISLGALLRLGYRNGNNRLRKELLSGSDGRQNRHVLAAALSQIGNGFRHILVGIAWCATAWIPVYGGRSSLYYGLIRSARGLGQLTSVFGVSYKYYR